MPRILHGFKMASLRWNKQVRRNHRRQISPGNGGVKKVNAFHLRRCKQGAVSSIQLQQWCTASQRRQECDGSCRQPHGHFACFMTLYQKRVTGTAPTQVYTPHVSAHITHRDSGCTDSYRTSPTAYGNKVGPWTLVDTISTLKGSVDTSIRTAPVRSLQTACKVSDGYPPTAVAQERLPPLPGLYGIAGTRWYHYMTSKTIDM